MSKELFRAQVIRGIENGKSGIKRNQRHDKGKGVIHGFAVMTKGFVQDSRGWEIDDRTLDQVISLGNRSKIGIKSRFGHPNMSGRALGSFLGRVKKLRKDGDIVRGDLFFDETAYKTPDGDLAGYVLDLAESDPEAFGTSIVFAYELEQRLNEDGTAKKNEDGEDLPPLLRVNDLFASDVVDDPAANKGMFSYTDSVKLSAEATEALDKILLSGSAREVIKSFLDRYEFNKNEKTEKYNCECIDCGYKTKSEKHCKDLKCPECGGAMRREERPGPGQETQTPTHKEEKLMELTYEGISVEALKKERPDLVEALQKETEAGSIQKGVDQERERCLSIVKHAHSEFAGAGVDSVVDEALEKGKSFKETELSMREKRLADKEAEANKAPGPDAEALKKEKEDSKKELSPEDHLKLAKEHQAKKGGSITEALKATAK